MGGRIEPMTRVLVVEDERALLRALAMNLTARGYEVTEAETGTRALTAAAAVRPDVILLDLGLPDLSGLDVIRGVRTYTDTPIVVLSARTGTGDKVDALDLGADDYVTKPFTIDELLARLRAVTRRGAGSSAGGPNGGGSRGTGGSGDSGDEVVEVGGHRVDLGARTVTAADGAAVHLTPTEWRLLEALVRRPGKLVTGRALLTELRGSPEHTDPSYLRIYVASLRRKLEPEPSRPRHLLTEPGMGYRFQP
jgi:two-component system KDP operon response regulator KdpE